MCEEKYKVIGMADRLYKVRGAEYWWKNITFMKTAH